MEVRWVGEAKRAEVLRLQLPSTKFIGFGEGEAVQRHEGVQGAFVWAPGDLLAGTMSTHALVKRLRRHYLSGWWLVDDGVVRSTRALLRSIAAATGQVASLCLRRPPRRGAR